MKRILMFSLFLAVCANAKPAWEKPIETRVASPYGALVKVRHENTMRLDVVIYPKPLAQDNTWHVWQASYAPLRGENTPMEDWMEITTDSKLQKQSTAKELNYDLALEAMNYDPLELVYTYDNGTVTYRVHDTSAFTVTAAGPVMTLGIDSRKLTRENDLFYGSMKSTDKRGHYYGILARSADVGEGGTIRCSEFAVVWGDSKQELMRTANKVRNWNKLYADRLAWIEERTAALQLFGNDPLANEVEMQKRMFTGTQFAHGGIFAALDTWYERIWVRDAAAATLFPALAGYSDLLKKWAPYLLENPVFLEHDGGTYSVFITCPTGFRKWNKWEQDGTFYATLSAYGFWKLYADDTMLEKWYATLMSSLDFAYARDYSKEYGLYAETYINEAPFKDAFGWEIEQLEEMKIDGQWATRMYTYYLNSLMYSTHLMLGEIALHLGMDGEATDHFGMADSLQAAIDAKLWDEENDWYIAGIGILEDGTARAVDWRYYNISMDYAWAEALYPTTSNPQKTFRQMNTIWAAHHAEENPVHSYFSPVWAHDAAYFATAGQYGQAREALDVIMEDTPTVGWNDHMEAIYAMEGAMVEIIKVAPYHHRPQTFAAGPFMQAAVALGMVMDYNGVTLMPSGTYTRLEQIHYRDAVLEIDLAGAEKAIGLVVDGQEIPGTLKVPNELLSPGAHKVGFLMGEPSEAPLLLQTHLELVGVEETSSHWNYVLKGYGASVLRFHDVVKEKDVSVEDGNGTSLIFKAWKAEGGTRVQFNAGGEVMVKIKK